MIRIWPQSLYGRNAVLLFASIMLSTTVSLVSAYIFILNAQLNRVSSIGAEMVNVISGVAYDVSPDVRDSMLAELDAGRFLQVLPLGVTPEIGEFRENILERVAMQRFIDRLEFQNEMEWRVGANRTLWLRLRIGDDYYWIAAESETRWTPIRLLFFFLFVIAGIISAIAIIATRQISRPLAALRQETDRLTLDGDWRIAKIRGPSEITALAKSFNLMTERLKEAESIRAETLAELSHDVRTPLARLRLAVEMMSDSDELKDSATRQVHEIDRLIGQFLDYARGGQSEPKAEFSLSALVRDVADQFGLQTDLDEDVSLFGQQEYIRRALINLAENAQKYGKPPVSIRLSQSPSHAIIEVHDRGEGFDPKTTSDMLKSFKRGDHASHVSGSGLGLTIVDRVAAAHQGNITFSKTAPDGFTARLSLALNPVKQ